MLATNPLHRARLDRGLDLAEVARRTHLSPWIVGKIDTGLFGELPAGIYARAYVRSFAGAVGLDPDETVRELSDRLPQVDDPLPAMREIVRESTPAWMVLLTAWTCSTSVWLAATGRRGSRVRLAARALDACLLLAIYFLLVRLTALSIGVPAGIVFGHPGVAALWLLLVAHYFLLLGGIGGMTLGSWALGLELRAPAPPLRWRAILSRALL